MKASARGRASAVVLLAALPAAACGGEAGDLLALEVSGGLQQRPVRLTVTEDGRGSCDGDALEAIRGDELLEARDIEREIEGLASEGASFGDPAAAGPNQRRSYLARTREGSVRWVEGTSGLPEALPRAALLAQELQEELCES